MERHFRIFLLLAALGLLYRTSIGQDGLFHGQVIDAELGRPLAGAHVFVSEPSIVLVTDVSGSFGFRWDLEGSRTITVSHIGYGTGTIQLVGKELERNTPYIVGLMQGSVPIPEVVIRRSVPEVVVKSEHLHVGDHEPSSDGLWVLMYERPQLWHSERNAGAQLFKHASLLLLDEDLQELATCPLPERVRQLHRDHQGRIIVEGEHSAWLAVFVEGRVKLYAMDREWLHTAVLPWTDSIPGSLLGNTRVATYPAFDHIAYDPRSEEQFLICSIEDRHTMSLFRSQYKYMSGRDKVIAMDLELETSVDREVIAGHMTGFHHDPYFHLPYAPLFVVDGTLCVFDHATDRIRRFGMDRRHMGDIPIAYHKDRGWGSRLLQDAAHGTIYALFKRGPDIRLCAIDPDSGKQGEPRALTHPYPEAIKVFDGYAYYVYRPYGSTQHNTLYREAIDR